MTKLLLGTGKELDIAEVGLTSALWESGWRVSRTPGHARGDGRPNMERLNPQGLRHNA
ncbi:hypothetical protein MJK72_14055 [Klebsiella pneumoniae]|nr:hypothetical protein MJK72_14055 [Klebsiella pneumoniae]